VADISDVETAMVGLIAGFLQLGATYFPPAAVQSPVALAQCKVFRGWPTAAKLEADLAAGISNVSVFPVPGAGRRTTRYVPQWNPGPKITPTLLATVDGSTVIITGVPTVNQVIGIRFGAGFSPTTVTYRPSVSDTTLSIAAALGAMISDATVTGPVITIPDATNLATAVVVDQQMWAETRRQDQHIWVIGWCPAPLVRDVVMKAVDSGFGDMLDASGNLTDQFPLPDGSSARLLYMSSHTDDQAQKSGVWRRDLRYIVSYPTITTQFFPTVIFNTVSVTDTDSDTTVSTTVGPSPNN
jgi:hypothetical protein